MAVFAVAGIAAAAAAGGAAAAGLATTAVLTAASIGWAAGTMLGGLLFPVKGPDTQGPRLGDLTITGSTYGNIIPIVYGTARMGGNVIWAQPITEVKTTTHSGGKGFGGSGSSQTTFTYFGTFAIGLCEGPVNAILRIWADSGLIYDATGGADTVRTTGLKFRFYPGDEAQLPDSIIEANEGIGNVPGHRGLCYLVFDALPLANYGNRVPNITVEVTLASAEAFNHADLTLLTGGANIFSGVSPDNLAIDTRRNFAYVTGTGGPSGAGGLRRFTISDMVEDRQQASTAIWTDASTSAIGQICCGPDGTIYAFRGVYEGVFRIDPNSLRETASFAGSFFPGGTDGSHISTPTSMCAFEANTILGPAQFVLVGSLFSSWSLLAGANLSNITFGSIDGAGIQGLVGGQVGDGTATAFILSGGTTTNFAHVYVTRLDCRATVNVGLDGTPTVSQSAAATEIVAMDAADIEAGATQFWAATGGLLYDAADDTVIFVVNVVGAGGGIGNDYAVKYDSIGNLIWKTLIPLRSAAVNNQATINGGVYALMRGLVAIQIDSPTGTLLYQSTWPSGFFTVSPTATDGTSGIMLAHNNFGWSKLYVNRQAPADMSLGAIFEDICLRAGYAAGDIDISALDSTTLTGFVISSQASASANMRDLALAFLVDCVESDYQLKFKLRGGSTVADLFDTHQIRLNNQGSESYTETRQQEIELPSLVTIDYMDKQIDYQTNTQRARRVRSPDPTVFSDNYDSLSLAAVLTADIAKQQAEAMLFSAWEGRHRFDIQMPWTWLWLDAADPVTFTISATGYRVRARMDTFEIGADFTIKTTLIVESGGQYVSAALGAQGQIPLQIIAGNGPSELTLLDVPLLRDEDDAGNSQIRAYWGGAPYTETNWPGGEMQQSPDSSTWLSEGFDAVDTDWGYVTSVLPDRISVFHTLTSDSLTVTMMVGGGNLASITDAQLVNGFNAAAVVKLDGEVEVIQFRDVVKTGPTEWTLSALLRGRRGTDTMAKGYLGGEKFVLLNSRTLVPFHVPMSQRNTAMAYRLITAGEAPEEARLVGQVFHGRDKMPYAPVQLTATLSGSDIVLAWVRRSRMGGELTDGTGDIPLHEDTEAYQVDILAAPGGAVKRTLTGLTSPTATYTAAEIAADFGSTPASLSLVVYQISATVGRGFGREDLIGVV